MSRATPQLLDVARRLIGGEPSNNKPAGLGSPTAFHVCEKLRPHLATLMGKAVFRAVLSRALTVVRMEAPWMAGVEVNADGALEGWDQLQLKDEANQLEEAEVLLVAHLLGLLIAFIGGNLTWRLVCDVWPKLSLDDLKFTQGDPS